MPDIQGQSYEVIAKEITIAIIQKLSTSNPDNLLEYACKMYDKIYKQLRETYKSENK